MTDTTPQTTLTAVASVKAWMTKHGYSTGGSDNIGYLLTNLECQIWTKVRAETKEKAS